mmetsp:Transcript_22154/g.71583  ORF Transcript_22154/g.71583 Transcript_22154/m.71583 type:complete len:253 (-) Transcript_22154:149-907(-)
MAMAAPVTVETLGVLVGNCLELPTKKLAIDVLGREVRSDGRLPLIAILEKFLFVVKELLMSLCRILEIWPLYDSVDRACLLAEAAVDALGHVNVVTSRTTGAIRAHLRLNGDRLSRTNGFAQLARNAALVARRVTTEGVLAAKARTKRPLLHGIVDGHLLLPEHDECETHGPRQLCDPDRLHSPSEHRIHAGRTRVLVARGLSVRGCVPPPILQRKGEWGGVLCRQELLLKLLCRLSVALSSSRGTSVGVWV